jgi:hypothetical protein
MYGSPGSTPTNSYAYSEEFFLAVLLLLVFLVVPALITSFVYRRYLPGPSRAPWACLAYLVGAAIVLGRLLNDFPNTRLLTQDAVHPVVAALLVSAITAFFAVPLLVAQWQKWFARGAAGIKQPDSPAWITGGDIICIMGAALCAYVGGDSAFGATNWSLSGWAVAALGLLVLSLGPIARLILQAEPTPPITVDPLSDDRQRVLKLLEENRITADESAELLNALGQTKATTPVPSLNFTTQNKLLLIGAAIVFVGFLLPWFAINLGQEMGRLTHPTQMNRMTRPTQWTFYTPQPVQGAIPGQAFNIQTATSYISGGDVARGLGWLILFAAVAVACLPLIDRLSDHARRTTSFILLALGAALLLYLLSSSWRHVHVGIVIVIGGYILQTVALLRSKRATQPLPIPNPA